MEKAQLTVHHETDPQRIAIPARALAQQADAADRAVRLRPGIRHEPDEVAKPAQPQAELQILAGADVETALLQEDVAPIHRAGAGQAGDRADDVEDRTSRR